MVTARRATWPPSNVGKDGRYEIGEVIGRGGMGVVHAATDLTLGRQVAVKLINLTESPGMADRFTQEARIAAGLAHPNIVTVHDYGIETLGLGSDEICVGYLVMERLAGPSLAKVVREGGALPVDVALTYVEEAARGLQSAHARGVLHRDVKPQNLMLDEHGTVKVLDFGIAQMNDPTRTATQAIAGTIAYIAPERMNGKRATVSSDLYSLGCVLFELLTGRTPYVGTTAEIVAKAVSDSFVADSPSLLRPELPTGLDPIVGQLLATHPDQRFPRTAGDLATTLSAFRANGAAEPWMIARTQRILDHPTLVDTHEADEWQPSGPDRATPGTRAARPGRVIGWGTVAAVVLAATVWLSWTLKPGSLTAEPQPTSGATAPASTADLSTTTTRQPTTPPATPGPSATGTSRKPKPTPTPKPTVYQVTYDQMEGRSSKSYRSFPVGGVPFIYAAGTSPNNGNTFASTTCSRLTIRAAIPDKNSTAQGVLQISQGESNPIEIPVTKGNVAKRTVELTPNQPLIITPIGSYIWWNGEFRCTTPDGR